MTFSDVALLLLLLLLGIFNVIPAQGESILRYIFKLQVLILNGLKLWLVKLASASSKLYIYIYIVWILIFMGFTFL